MIPGHGAFSIKSQILDLSGLAVQWWLAQASPCLLVASCSLRVWSCLAMSTLSSRWWFQWDWRTSQEGAWCLTRSDTDNWITQNRGARKSFSFQFHSAEVRLTFHSVFVSAQGQILQDNTEFLHLSFASLRSEDAQMLDWTCFIVLHYS